MKRRNKLIIPLLLIILIIPIGYFGISGYLHDLEEQTFYDGIKNISDIENKTDAKGDVLRNQTTPSHKDIKEYDIESINVTSTEILMLQDLKNKVSNKSYIEFIDIQINRLNSENRTYTTGIASADIYDQYLNGQIGASKALSLIKDKNKEIDSYTNKTREYKIDADSFLSVHTDMKSKFNEMGIDEDFLYNQVEEVKSEYIT